MAYLTGGRPSYAVCSVRCFRQCWFGRKLVRLWATSPLRSATRRVRCSRPKWMVIMAKRLPNEHEAIEGARVATATAARLLSGADLLADVGSYGIARSLAVLALEESVKARSLGAIAAAAAPREPPRLQ